MKGNHWNRLRLATYVALVPSFVLAQALPPSKSLGNDGSEVAGRVTFTATTVLVKYVAGTLPHNEKERRALLRKGLGCLVSTEDALVFGQYKNQSQIGRLTGFLFHLVDPSWLKGGGQCAHVLPSLPIAYGDMQVLARGQVQSMSSVSGGDSQLISGIGSLAGAAALQSTAGYIGLGTVSGVSFAYYLNRRTQNYITVFVGKDTSQQPGAKGADDNFSPCKNKCDFAVFQIVDPHDYWNTSMLLNAMTGKTFIAESAEKGGDSSSK